MKALTTQPDPARPYGSSGLLPIFIASVDAHGRNELRPYEITRKEGEPNVINGEKSKGKMR